MSLILFFRYLLLNIVRASLHLHQIEKLHSVLNVMVYDILWSEHNHFHELSFCFLGLESSLYRAYRLSRYEERMCST